LIPHDLELTEQEQNRYARLDPEDRKIYLQQLYDRLLFTMANNFDNREKVRSKKSKHHYDPNEDLLIKSKD